MKKNLLFVMATAAIFAGCSNSEVVDEKEGTNNPGVQPNGQVEVLLGATGSSISVTPTRGIVTGWDNTPIVVWGLDKAANSDWTNPSSLLFSDNGSVDAKVAKDPLGAVILGPTGTERYFYPMSSSVNFSFFACSPKPTTRNMNGEHQISAVYNFSGDTDILWGKAETKDPNANGYNAKYIRTSADDNTPNLKFEHMLTKLTFYAYKGEETNDVGKVTADVKAVQVLNVQNQATVYVAGGRENQLEGQGALTTFPLYNNGIALGSDTDHVSPVTPSVEDMGANLGTVMLLPATSYQIKVILRTDKGEEVPSDILTVSLPDNQPFERGRGYNVQLKVYDMRAVVLEATLTEWTNSTIIDTTVDIN